MTVEAYEPPDPNDWVRPIALGVTALLIAWNVCGWIIGKGWTFEGCFVAAMTGAFQLLSFNASAQMRRAASKERSQRVIKAHRFWTGCLFMCSAWSAYSAHHAFGVIVATDVELAWTADAMIGVLANAPALVVLTVAAFIEPFLPWAIETVEAAPRAVSKPTLATVEPSPIQAPTGAAKAVARELLRQSPRRASKTRRNAAEHRDVTRAPPLSEHELRQAVDDMTQLGKVVSIRAVAKHLAVPASRVERSPARHLLWAA